MPQSPSFFSYSLEDPDKSPGNNHILLHPTLPVWIAVNGTTLEVADLLNRGQSIEETAGHLTARYGISIESARDDVRYVAEELARQHFLCGAVRAPQTRLPALNSIFLHLTSRCNLSCSHCYTAAPANDDLPLPLILRLLDTIQEHQCFNVTLSGGEPLLHPEIRTILDCAAPKFKLQVLTNGTLIDREWAAILAQTSSSIQISVDGSTGEIHDMIRGEGTFDRAMRAIEYLQDAGLAAKLTLSATIMKQNLDDLPRIIALAERLGIPSVRFLPLRKSGRACEQWSRIGSDSMVERSESFYNLVFDLQRSRRCTVNISCGLSGFLLKFPDDESGDEYWCPVGRKLVVDVDGSIYPCVLLMGDEFLLGNAFHHGIEEVLHSDRMLKLCGTLLERRTKIRQCSECLWQNLCQAGCMGQAFDHHGTIWNTDHYCDFRKRAYQDAFDRILRGIRCA